MKQNMLQQAMEYAKQHHRKKRWQQVVTVLAAVVVFCTTYALILPAITLERTCDIPEHTHSDACYEPAATVSEKVLLCNAERLGIHQHTSSCYDANGVPVCGYADFVVHQYGASCYVSAGSLRCQLPEIKTHTHTASCYATPEAPAAHVHNDSCYAWEQGALICGKDECEGHTHTEEAGCFTTTSTLTCQTPESAGHKHTEACYDENGSLICGIAEGAGAHSHSESCYETTKVLTCTRTEEAGHHHTSECYEALRGELICTESTEAAAPAPVLVCGKKEVILHTHSAACYDASGNLTCGKLQVQEHNHSDSCFETTAADPDARVLICGMEEHTHTDACLAGTENEPTLEDSLSLLDLDTMDGISLFATESTTRADFSPYVTTVTYKDAAYNPATDQVEVSFGLNFKISSEVMHPAGEAEQHSFKFALPEGVTIPELMIDKPYDGEDTSGAVGFEYRFVKDGDGTYSILIDFDHDYVTGKKNFEGYINFDAYAGATNKEETEYKYAFTDKQTINIDLGKIDHPDEESKHYNITVDKSASTYDYTNNKITYKVIVDSTKGTPHPLNLTDVLRLDGLGVKNVVIGNVVREDRYDEWNMVYGSATNVTPISQDYNPETKTITMSLDGLGTGSVGNGQRYTITYDVYLDEPPAGKEYKVGNQVTASGEDKDRKETIKDTDETTTTINKGLDLKKEGTYNKERNSITWVITVNDNQNNIANSILKDDMFANINPDTVTFNPSNGIEWAGKDLKFTAVSGETNNQTYTITYTTPLPDDLTFTNGVAVVDNKATITPPGGEDKDADASVTIDKTVDVGKKGEYDKSQDKIKWTITINKNGNALTVKNENGSITSAVLKDDMFSQVNPEAPGFEVEPDQNGMNIEKNEDGTIKQITFSEIDNQANTRTYTITYYTTAPAEGDNGVAEVKNEAIVTPPDNPDYPDIPEKKDEETVVVNKAVDLTKYGSYDKATDTITWTIKVNQNGNNLAGKVLTDSFFSQFADKSQINISPENGWQWQQNSSLMFTAVENGVNNQTYTITYTTKSGIGVNASGKVYNTAKLDNKEVTTDVPVDRTITFVKDGSHDSDTQRIWWTIELNTNNQNIAGFTLTDTMFGEMADGTLQVFVNGRWEAYGESLGAYTIYRDEDGKVSSIVFNPVGSTGVNTQKYFIKYATPAPQGWDDYTKENTATVTPPGDKPIEKGKEVTVLGERVVSKSCESGELNGDVLEITWKLKVKIPAAGLPAGTTITDALQDGQWMTRDQILLWGSLINANAPDGTYTDGPTLTYADIVENRKDAGNRKYTGFTITFEDELSADKYGGKELWIQYKSYADVSKVADTQKYQNKVVIETPDGAKKEDTASYDFRKGGVYKTDGNGNKETTSLTTKDGKLTWKVRVRTSTDCYKVTVLDTLPPGVTLAEIKLDNTTLTIDGSEISANGDIWFNNSKLNVNGSITENSEGDGIQLVLTCKDGSGNPVKIPLRSEFNIYYTCQINQGTLIEMESGEAKIFTNNVTALQDDTPFPSDSHTQEVKYDESGSVVKAVDKTGGWGEESHVLDYSVTLNPKGEDLLSGSDTLTLKDVLTYTVYDNDTLIEATLLPGRMKLYEAHYNDERDLVKGDEVHDWSWKVETSAIEHPEWGTTDHQSTITATIPDGKILIFEYAYRVWLPTGSTVDTSTSWRKPEVTNILTLDGVADGSDKEYSKLEWKDSQTEGGIIYDQALVLYKVEKGNYGKALQGAEFTVYDRRANESVAVATYTTDADGLFTIQWDAELYEYNKLYYLAETKVPEGYLAPDPAEEYCFYFSNAEDTTNTLPDIPEDAIDLSTMGDQIYCENEKATTSITVDKKWFNPNGDDITASKTNTVSFGLYQIASTTKPDVGSGDSGETSGSKNVTFTLRDSYNYANSMGPTTGVNVSIGDKVEIAIAINNTNINQYWQPKVEVTSGLAEGWTSSWQFESPAVLKITGTVNASTVLIDTETGLDCIPSFVTKVTEPAAPVPEPERPAGTLYGTYSIGPDTPARGWKLLIDGLPKYGTQDNEDGTTTKLYYSYYIVENSGNYSTEYDNNGGIVSGTITMSNTESGTSGYVLPETGGAGTHLYTMGGTLLTAAAGILLYIQRKRRKEGIASS